MTKLTVFVATFVRHCKPKSIDLIDKQIYAIGEIHSNFPFVLQIGNLSVWQDIYELTLNSNEILA